MGNVPERQLLDGALDVLRRILPGSWSVSLTTHELPMGGVDTFLQLEGKSSPATVVVEPRTNVTPRQIQTEFGNPGYRRARAREGRPMVVVAPYLSPRSRELLRAENIGYLDLTGNVRIVVDYPPVLLVAEGASTAPSPERRRLRGLRGAAVGSIVRALVDVRPPYGVTELSRTARVDAGYVTRVLETLASEALIERGARGRVTDVDWPALLRRRAAAVDLLADAHVYVSPAGPAAVLERIRTAERTGLAITGSFAAAELAATAAATLLVVYTLDDPAEIASPLGLVPASERGDVALIRPRSPAPFFNARHDGKGTIAAPSQIAIDCLSGTGRMPAEGEAVVDWMERNETSWRVDSLSEATWPDWVPR